MRWFAACLVGAVLALAPTPSTAEGAEATYVLTQEGPDAVLPLTAVTEVLTAINAEGDPVQGLTVRFLRHGPGDESDESCPADELAKCAVTDAAGQARYDFIGGSIGTATVSAVVYDAEGLRLETVTDTVQFVTCKCTPSNAKLSGHSKAGRDVLRVDATSSADGARVRLQRKTTEGWKQAGKAGTLNARGGHSFNVIDRNGDGRTSYRARIAATPDRGPDTTNVFRLR